MIVPCTKGQDCNWPACSVACAGRGKPAEYWEGRAHRAEAALRFARARLQGVSGSENIIAWIDDVERQAGELR